MSIQLEGDGHYCPNCLAKIDGVTTTSGEDHVPGEGDVSVCIYCVRILTWSDDGWIGMSREHFDSLDKEHQNKLVGALVVFATTDRPGPTSRYSV